MIFTSKLIDQKIMGVNVGIELTVAEYLGFSNDILNNNEFQRRKVTTAGKTYSLLRKDLVEGCVMPPIILAVTAPYSRAVDDAVHSLIDQGDNQDHWSSIEKVILDAVKDKALLILDGLQRSITIKTVLENRDKSVTDEEMLRFLSRPIRAEIYVGLSKMGILYRMLTLNTGQTPMSFRHQLEILYEDYLGDNRLPHEISVYREIDEKRARGIGKYKYADVVDMFYAFSTGSPMPFDKQALVGELREMSFLESYSYKRNEDDMRELLLLHDQFVRKVADMSDDWAFLQENGEEVESNEIKRPFGTNVPSIFAKPQAMAGFGAECKRLLQIGAIDDVSSLYEILGNLYFSDDPSISLGNLLIILNDIGAKAKRIGDAQRVYFQFAFRSLLFKESDAHLDLSKCWLRGQEAYEMMY